MKDLYRLVISTILLVVLGSSAGMSTLMFSDFVAEMQARNELKQRELDLKADEIQQNYDNSCGRYHL